MDKTSTNNKKPRLQLVISVLVVSALFLAELYAMINQPSNIILMVGIGILVLIAMYFVVDAIMDCAEEKEIANLEQLDNISRSEKAAYMLLRKNMDEVVKAVAESAKNSGTQEEIIASQKAIAKVSMGKDRENTEAIMAANKAVYNKVAELEGMLGGSDSESQNRLFAEMNSLEASLNDKIEGLEVKLSGFQEEIERLVDHIAKINTEAIHEAVKTSGEREVVEDTFEDSFSGGFEEDTSVEDFLMDSIGEESEISLEDDIASLLEDSFSDISIEESSDDDVLSQLITEDTVALDELLAEAEPVIEEVPEEKPAMPDLSDPNKMMTPEDIAALIANQTAAPEPEPIPVPEPVVEEAVEEKPAMPDMSNPNKVMTPEEIAALIANM